MKTKKKLLRLSNIDTAWVLHRTQCLLKLETVDMMMPQDRCSQDLLYKLGQ